MYTTYFSIDYTRKLYFNILVYKHSTFETLKNKRDKNVYFQNPQFSVQKFDYNMSEIEKKENSETNTVEKSLTAEDVDIVAQRATNDPSIKVLEYSVSPYSSEAFGALGSYWSLKITMKVKNSLKFFYI